MRPCLQEMETSIWINGFPSTSAPKPHELIKYRSPVSSSQRSQNPWNKLIVRGKGIQPSSKIRRLPPIHVSTNPLDVNVDELAALLRATHQNCDQFPEILDDGSVKPVDPKKLKVALMNSTVVVSVHTGGEEEPYTWLDNLLSGARTQKSLVGFGRATSDTSLTASIYDIAVAPSFQRLGIGRKILRRIIRILTSRGIDDIAVLCSKEQRAFFQACGFGDDVLNSTTMLYSRGVSCCKGDEHVKYFGRKSLLVPSPLRPFSFNR